MSLVEFSYRYAMKITLANGTQLFDDDNVFFAVYGYASDPAKDPNAKWVYLDDNGVFQTCKIGDNCQKLYFRSLELMTSFELPMHLWSGQILFSYGELPKTFNVIKDGNGNPTLQLPSQDSQAADANTLFNTIEFTYDAFGAFWVNNTNVDSFVGPVTTTLVGIETQTRGELLPGVTRSQIFAAFEAAPAPFDQLVWKSGDTQVRIYNPTMATTSTTALIPNDYFDTVVHDCIHAFSGSPLTVYRNTHTYECQFNGTVLECKLDGTVVVARDFGSLIGDAHEIFGCGNSIFNKSGSMGAGLDIDPVLTAALNRGQLPANALLPNCGQIPLYPDGVPSNWYAKTLRTFFRDGEVYAFPYDDVCGLSSEIQDPTPDHLSITLGSWA